MAIKLEDKANVTAPAAPYPYGDVKDNTGGNDGTPMDRSVMSDYFQFFAKMLAESGITPNDLLENDTNGYQYHQALLVESRKALHTLETPWTAVSPLNGWLAGTAEYCKDHLGFVHFRGAMDGSSNTSLQMFALTGLLVPESGTMPSRQICANDGGTLSSNYRAFFNAGSMFIALLTGAVDTTPSGVILDGLSYYAGF